MAKEKQVVHIFYKYSIVNEKHVVYMFYKFNTFIV